MRKLKCLFGHKWETINKISDREMFSTLNIGLQYEYSIMIEDRYCTKCGEEQLDIKDHMENIRPGSYDKIYKSQFRERRLKKLLEKSK